MKRFLLTLLSAGLFAGCATTWTCDVGGKTTVNVFNTGWYLFNVIPLASGNPDAPNECDFRLFTQTTTLANNTRMLDHAATACNAIGLKDISTDTSDESVFIILLKRHIIHTSAELILPPKEKPAS